MSWSGSRAAARASVGTVWSSLTWAWWRHWPSWAGYAAGVLSLVYGALGLYWSVGGDGFPFAPVDPTRASGSILESSRPDVVAPVIAVLGLLGAVVAWVMTRHVRPGHLSTALLAIVPASIVALTIIPAGLMLLWTEQARGSWAVWVPSLFWPVWGVALGAAAIAYHRRRRGTCRHCGQGHPAKRPALAEAAGQPPAVRA